VTALALVGVAVGALAVFVRTTRARAD